MNYKYTHDKHLIWEQLDSNIWNDEENLTTDVENDQTIRWVTNKQTVLINKYCCYYLEHLYLCNKNHLFCVIYDILKVILAQIVSNIIFVHHVLMSSPVICVFQHSVWFYRSNCSCQSGYCQTASIHRLHGDLREQRSQWDQDETVCACVRSSIVLLLRHNHQLSSHHVQAKQNETLYVCQCNNWMCLGNI